MKLSKLSPQLFKSIAVISFVLTLIFISIWLSRWMFLRPVSQVANVTKVVIDQGLETSEIAKLLEDKNLIRDRRVFLSLAKLRKTSHHLEAGEYSLSPHMSYLDILDKLENGSVILRKFTVPEGMTIKQIAGLWEKYNFGKREDFVKAASRVELLKELKIFSERLKITNLEGYLFPETYRFAEGTDAQTVVDLMFREFCKRLEKKLVDTTKGSESSPSVSLGSIHEIITLASIIEREANVDKERPIISAVYHNRLNRKQKLDADPTVLYALGNYKKRLTYDDLKIDSPYNTYKYRGLPPGPICNPGAASVLAAINPAKNSYLYFVAKGDGMHYFSKNFSEHRRAIAKARRRFRR